PTSNRYPPQPPPRSPVTLLWAQVSPIPIFPQMLLSFNRGLVHSQPGVDGVDPPVIGRPSPWVQAHPTRQTILHHCSNSSPILGLWQRMLTSQLGDMKRVKYLNPCHGNNNR